MNLDQPLDLCPCCDRPMTWESLCGYHSAACPCGWQWTGPAPATVMHYLPRLERVPALLGRVLAALDSGASSSALPFEVRS